MTLPERWVSAGRTYESGQAWVYQVRRRGDADGPLFALKRLKNPSPNRMRRFAREIAAMERLRREHGLAVPEVVDSDLDAERPWFVMPWYGGGSLDAAVEDARYRTDPLGGIRVLIELAQIVMDVHAAGLAHRDLKPPNVLFGESGLVLADFGLCLEIDDLEIRLTDPDEPVGSRLYLAPENEAGINNELDQRPADAYAFGKLAWAILAGRQPLPREAVLEPEHHLASDLDDPRLAALDRLLRDLVTRDPRARLIDWTLVVRDLRAVERALQGIGEVEIAPSSERALAIARRVAHLPQVEAAVSAGDERRHREAWGRQAVDAMRNSAEIARPTLHALTRELGDLLSLSVTTGGVPREHQLVGSRTDEVPHLTDDMPPGIDSTDGAVCFLIHSPREVPALPTFTVRVWLSTDGGQIWINRIATVCPVGGGETIAPFLISPLAARIGPLPPLRQATLEEAAEVVRDTAGRFVALCEHYLEIVDRGGDPASPLEWDKREILPAAMVSTDGSGRGDTQAPDLRSLEVIPSRVELDDGPVDVICRARIVDDAAGVAGEGFRSSPSQARFRSPSGQIADVLFDQTHRISGDALDGVYEDRLRLSPQGERGFWVIDYVLVVDQVGNARRYSSADLTDRGMPSRFEVQ